MNEKKLTESIANMCVKSRLDADKSQEAVAKALGVSKRTVQNWEAGDAIPNLKMALLWFEAVGLPMYPYLMEMLYPEQFKDLKKGSDIKEIKDALHIYIDELDNLRARELLFALYGSHGSSPTGTLDLMNTYLHLPLPMRVCIANDVLMNYEIASASGNIRETDNVLPAVDTLRRYVKTAKTAVLNGKDAYNFTEEDLEL